MSCQGTIITSSSSSSSATAAAAAAYPSVRGPVLVLTGPMSVCVGWGMGTAGHLGVLVLTGPISVHCEMGDSRLPCLVLEGQYW